MGLLFDSFEYIYYIIQKAILYLISILMILLIVLVECSPILIFCYIADIIQKKYIATTPYIEALLVIAFMFVLSLYAFFAWYVAQEEENITRNSFLSQIENYPNILLFLIERKHALYKGRKYLVPYKDVRRNLKLVNHNLIITLSSDSTTIICQEKHNPDFKIKTILKPLYKLPSKTTGSEWAYTDVWNALCKKINPYTTFSDIAHIFTANNYINSFTDFNNCLNEDKNYIKDSIDAFDDYLLKFPKLALEKNVPKENSVENSQGEVKVPSDIEKNDIEERDCIDVNNCSEIELKNLPGINIIMAKKIIIRREEVGGFKSIEEFIQYLKPTSAIESQLRKMVKIGSVARNIYTLKNERQIDI